MSDEPQRRYLHVLVPDAAGRAVLATAAGPVAVETELAGDETTAMAAVRMARDVLGLHTPLRELFFDVTMAHDDEGHGAVPALAVFEAPGAGWPLPPGHRWRPLTEVDPPMAPGLAAQAAGWLAQWRGDEAPAPSRPRWSEPGWYDRAHAWIAASLAAVGRRPCGRPEQVRHWGISALMRVETDLGRAWFKAVFPGFRQEVAVTSYLALTAAGAVAPVLAADEHEGWLLLEDVGSQDARQDPDLDTAAIRLLVSLQRASIGRTDEFVALGCPQRPLDQLAEAVAGVLADPVVGEWIEVTPERAQTLVTWVRDAADRVTALGFPTTLVHGDFHPGNVAARDGRPVLFDWSDAALAHPLVDALTGDEERRTRAWPVFLAEWSDVCPAAAVDALRPVITGLLAGYHMVSYAAIVTGLEPRRRAELADGLQEYFGALDAAVAD